MLQQGWFLPRGDFSGMHAWLFMTKGESWGAHPQPASALLHGGDDRVDSTCARGCDPPAARCCRPSLPAGPVPRGVRGALRGGWRGEAGQWPGQEGCSSGWETSWVEAGRAGGKRCGNRDHHTSAGLSMVGCLGKGGACLTPEPLGIKELKALLCPGPQQLPARPARSSQGHHAASVISDAASKPQGCLVPPSMATGCRTVSGLGSTCPWGQGTAPEQRWSSFSPTACGETHPNPHCFTQPLASGRPPTRPPSLNASRRWKKHLRQPGMTRWHRANTVRTQSCEHLCAQR